MTQYFYEHHHRIALGGLILSLPALTLVTLGPSFSLFDSSGAGRIIDALGVFIHPFTILFGLLSAFILNVFAVIQVRVRSEEESLSLNVVAKKFYGNWGITIILVKTLAMIVLLYVFEENFQIVTRW